MNDDFCRVCGTNAGKQRAAHGIAYWIDCPVCGRYKITDPAGLSLESGELSEEERFLLSGTLRTADEASPIEVNQGIIRDLVEAADPPHDPLDALDRVLWYLHDRSKRADAWVPVDQATEYPLLFLRGPDEFQYILRKMCHMEWLETDSQGKYRLSLEGWKRLRELAPAKQRGRQAFVAMWFSEETQEVWEDGIRAAVEGAGFHAVRIDEKEHNERIDEQIISEIRRSRFVIADFTGHRYGVYFEAGYGLGLGLPVIWCCHADQIDASHFDTRQYNHILWNSPQELHDGLVARIDATVLPRIE